MVEINVTDRDAALVDALVLRLHRLFDRSTVSYDAVRKQLRVGSGEEGSAVAVVQEVKSWLDESGVASALLATADRSYALVGHGRGSPAIDEDPQGRTLATISVLVRSAYGAADSITLLGRICESLSRTLGFERAGIARNVPSHDPPDMIAAHRWPLHELAEIAASGDVQAILGEAEDTGAVVFCHGIKSVSGPGPVVVVPLITGDGCHSFLLADRRGAAFDLDDSDQVLLATLGTIISALLDKTISLDELAKVGNLKTDFIALASHELRTPTAALCGIAATLHQRGDGLSAQQRRSLSGALQEQGQRLQRLVDQLLDLSRLEATSVSIAPAPLAVRNRTEEIVRGVAAGRADEIELHIDPGLLMDGDADAFDRIVSNLITNALRYGRRPIAVSASTQDRHFRLAVEDRGPGVSPELEPQLFDRFTRGDNAAKSGTGLGLSIARSYARAHGGELVYERASPHGARFELVMPAASARPATRTSLKPGPGSAR
jgi:signal transduction histidine kinase